ncbi:helix-turn-helix domain-containing protein [Aerococcaceae bacterium NML190073]|nr:helix-turn-helix domain-containing protein [Aerococcaceae bacterium NML190073]
MERKKLKEARIKKGLLQSQVAEKAQISLSHYSAIERGFRNPAYGVMVRIANVFGVKPDYFFYSKNQHKVENKG